jgi:predicted DNA-binding protein (MmcQ/YjbR family)
VSASVAEAVLLAAVRDVCLRFPEAAEHTTWGHPTFRVRNKIFATFGVSEEEPPRHTMAMKAAPGEQQMLLAVGAPFFTPKYVGSKGWIGIVVDGDTDWEEIGELVEESYRVVAPKILVRRLDEG